MTFSGSGSIPPDEKNYFSLNKSSQTKKLKSAQRRDLISKLSSLLCEHSLELEHRNGLLCCFELVGGSVKMVNDFYNFVLNSLA